VILVYQIKQPAYEGAKLAISFGDMFSHSATNCLIGISKKESIEKLVDSDQDIPNISHKKITTL
jgi:hypothetical protein